MSKLFFRLGVASIGGCSNPSESRSLPVGNSAHLSHGSPVLLSVSYGDLVTDVERCKNCWCCTACTALCGGACMGGREQEDDDDVALRVLGVDLDSVDMERAKAFRKVSEEKEVQTFREVFSDEATSEESDNEYE